MKQVRWGVLSTADIGLKQVIPAIFKSGNAEMAAISSRSSKSKSIAAKLGIPKAYESYEQLLEDPDIDAVYIPLPNHLHREWTIKAAKAGKHVLCEKPASLTSFETREMVKACQEHGVKFMEAFMYQFHPQHRRVKEIIAAGEIGEVRLFKSSFSFYLENRKENIRMEKEMGGGSVYDVGCYTIHAARNILESEPVEVQMDAIIDETAGVDTSATGVLTFDNGVKAILDCSFDMAGRDEYEVVGTKGIIRVPYAFRPDVNGGIGQVIIRTDGVVREEKIPGDIYRLEIELFSRAILEGIDPVYSEEETIRNMEIIDACYRSIQEGKPVKMR